MLLYTLTKKIMKVQGNMLNIWHHVVLQSGVVVLWPKHWCEVKKLKVQSPLPTYITCKMYIHRYTLYMCVKYNS
jgi:hypothetical protein